MESLWNTLAGEQFEESPYRPVQVGGVTMCALYVDRNNEERKYTTDLYFDTGLSFVAKPRFLSYRHRFVLVPKDNISGANRWDMRASDVADWIRWSEHMSHTIVTSTFKSGASVPSLLHAQSFGARREGQYLSSLVQAQTSVVVPWDIMPLFQEVQIAKLHGYPLNGLKLSAMKTCQGLEQISDKAFELALNYDHLKAFNLVIVPENTDHYTVYFVPRKKSATTIYGLHRWQIGSYEMNGQLQAPSQQEADDLTEAAVLNMYRTTCLDEEEFDEFQRLIHTF